MQKASKDLTLKTFKSIYSKVPRLCVDLVIQNPSGILLTLRSIEPKKGFWHLPGGTVLFKESVKEAVKRVAKRELGVSVSVLKFLGVIEHYKYGSTVGHSVSLAYQVQPKGKIRLNKEASDFDYFKKAPSDTIKEVKSFLKDFYG